MRAPSRGATAKRCSKGGATARARCASIRPCPTSWPSPPRPAHPRRSAAGRGGGSSPGWPSRWSPRSRAWRSSSPLAAVAARPRRPLAAPHFVDEATAAGIDHTYDGDFEYFVGGGVAAFDCDDDGRAELFFAGGSEPAALYRNESPVGGALRFTRQASPVTDLTAVTGAYPLDVDSDGQVDLAVLRRGGNVMLRGLGDCRFEPANDRSGSTAATSWTTAFSATWEGSNALPTLAFGNYLVPGTHDRATTASWCGPRRRAIGTPRPSPLHARLLHAVDAVQRLEPVRPARPAHDQRPQLLPRRRGAAVADRARRAAPPVHRGRRVAPAADLGHGHRQPGPDRRRLPRGVPHEPGRQQAADARRSARPNRRYQDIAARRGVTAQRPFTGGDVLPSTAWHPEFEDVNNDGFVDLFVTKGNVEAQPDYATRDPSNLLLGQADGTFVEGAEAAGIVELRPGPRGRARRPQPRRDARPRRRQPPGERQAVAQRRRGDAEQPAPMGHWIAVRLQQPAPNVDAIGAWVEVQVGDRTVAREVTVGGGHAGGKLGWIHAGLGDADSAEVRVQWPDGETGPWMTVEADQFVTIERGATEADPVAAGAARAMTATSSQRARLADVALPDFGMPATEPLLPAVDLRRAGWSDSGPRMEARGYDHLVVWADREHSANIAYLTGFDPRFEEAVLDRRADGRSRPSSSATSATAWRRRRRCRCGSVRFQDLSLPGQPRDDVEAAGRDPRATRASGRAAGWASSAGRRTRAARRSRPRVPRRRAPAGLRRRRAGRERDRPADRRRRRAPRHQRGRAARGVRVGGVPDVARRAATC